MDKNQALVVFQDQKIRRIWHKNEWFYSVVDIVAVLTEQIDPPSLRESTGINFVKD